MFAGLTGLALAVSLTLNTTIADVTPHYESIGEYRITTYEICCNDPVGRQSASGKTLEYGDVAMNGVPFGTKICIDGEEFTVVDRCGVDNTVDIFIENDSGCCNCNYLDYKEVFVKYD